MKTIGNHWAVLIGISFVMGCGKPVPQADGSKALTISDPSPSDMNTDCLGIHQNGIKLSIPGNHKLTVCACAYRDGKYDPMLSKGYEMPAPGNAAYTAVVTSGFFYPGTLTGEPTTRTKVFGAVSTRLTQEGLTKSNSLVFLNHWVDLGDDGRQASFHHGTHSPAIGRRAFWYGIACGAGETRVDEGGIQSPKPLVVNSYYLVEEMTPAELEGKSAGRDLDMSVPPKGLPLELKSKLDD